jgi:cob(I)alamin adenosyltransferase
MKHGLIQLYTGDGKGKTTAAIGLAVRAAGHGLNSYIGQFMKGQSYGELAVLDDHPRITLEQYGDPDCIHREDVTPQHVSRAYQGLERAREAMISGKYDVVVLDEVCVAIWFGLLDLQEVLQVLDQRPETVELVMTGRNAPPALLDRADLVTDMKAVKHYYDRGVAARDGIER